MFLFICMWVFYYMFMREVYLFVFYIGVGFIIGMWRFRELIDLCVDRIFVMDGSRM